MPSLLIATKNAHKTSEIAAVLGPGWGVTDLCVHPEISSPDETGDTFAENASIKALAASRRFAGWVLADDSGLSVDALGGAPGVVSARYAGEGASDEDNRRKLIAAMSEEVEPVRRGARFECVLALAHAGVVRALFHGRVEGHLLREEQGTGGFGYDSLFVPQGEADSFGVLPAEVKNRMSHRARALAAFRQWLDANASLFVQGAAR
jgi:XTP/dITP diphosphohydrolase